MPEQAVGGTVGQVRFGDTKVLLWSAFWGATEPSESPGAPGHARGLSRSPVRGRTPPFTPEVHKPCRGVVRDAVSFLADCRPVCGKRRLRSL